MIRKDFKKKYLYFLDDEAADNYGDSESFRKNSRTNLKTENHITMLIMAQNYPFNILKKEEVDNIIKKIENHGHNSTDFVPNYGEKCFEKGCLKILCLDEKTSEFLQDKVRSSKFSNRTIKIFRKDKFPKYLKMSCIMSEISHEEFLNEIKEQNKIDTTNWTIENLNETNDKALRSKKNRKFIIYVDLLSATYIRSRNFYLDIKGKSVQFKVMINYLRKKTDAGTNEQ